MSEAVVHVVPTDPKVPYPVDLGRVETALRPLGEVRPWGDVRGTLEFNADGETFLSSFDSTMRYLSLRRLWHTTVSHGPNEQIFMIAADNWNRDHYFPTVYTITGAKQRATVVADATIECRHGLSEAQLNDFLMIALSTCSDAIEYMTWSIDQLLSLR